MNFSSKDLHQRVPQVTTNFKALTQVEHPQVRRIEGDRAVRVCRHWLQSFSVGVHDGDRVDRERLQGVQTIVRSKVVHATDLQPVDLETLQHRALAVCAQTSQQFGDAITRESVDFDSSQVRIVLQLREMPVLNAIVVDQIVVFGELPAIVERERRYGADDEVMMRGRMLV